MSENKFNIQWYPGHMTKTKRFIEKNIKMVDMVLEIVDARIPRSSQNPDFDYLLKTKKRLVLLNKCDLADEKINYKWKSYFESMGKSVLLVSSTKGIGVKQIVPKIREILSDEIAKASAKGMNKILRVMVNGVPNVGKSTLINTLAGRKSAKVEDRPGVTRGGQWISLEGSVELLDTPGILWPKFEEEEIGLFLAFTGAIKTDILDKQTLCLKFIEFMCNKYPDNLRERYKLESISDLSALQVYDMICKKRGFIFSKDDYDYERAATIILDEFQAGRLGRISLEEPKDNA